MRRKLINKFKKEYKDICLKIIDEIMRHPISEVFHQPVDPVADEVPDYLEIVRTPSDLSTVRKRLTTDQYQGLDEFKRDVNLIWDNAILYNGRQSLPAYIADELSRIFRRQMYTLEELTPEQWTADYLKARATMAKLFRTPPASIASAVQAQGDSNCSPPPQPSWKVSPADLQFLQEHEHIFREPALQEQLIKFIQENEPEIPFSHERFSLELTKVSPRTLNLLKNWIKELESDN